MDKQIEQFISNFSSVYVMVISFFILLLFILALWLSTRKFKKTNGLTRIKNKFFKDISEIYIVVIPGAFNLFSSDKSIWIIFCYVIFLLLFAWFTGNAAISNFNKRLSKYKYQNDPGNIYKDKYWNDKKLKVPFTKRMFKCLSSFFS